MCEFILPCLYSFISQMHLNLFNEIYVISYLKREECYKFIIILYHNLYKYISLYNDVYKYFY